MTSYAMLRSLVGSELCIRDTDHIELAALGGLRDLDIVLEVDAGVGLRPLVPPRRDMVAGRIEESAEPELRLRSCHDGSSAANLAPRANPAQALQVS
jgi:hypothetical protein